MTQVIKNILATCFLLTLPYCFASQSLDVVMIADIIRAMERPSTVIATVCWSSEKKVELITALTSEDVTHFTMIRYYNIDFVPERHHPDQHIVFLADLNCPNIADYFKQSVQASHFRSPFRWFIVGATLENLNQNQIPETLTDVDVFPDAEVIISYFNGKDSFVLHNVYRISSGSNWQIEYFGSWNLTNSLQMAEDMKEPAALRRKDLQHYVIPICYVVTDNDSVNHLMDRLDDHIDTITKVNFPITNHLLDFLNADRKYIFDNTWGYFINGSWNGMTGYMVRGEVEIGGSPMFFTSQRIPFVDFITSPTPTRSKFVFQQPKLSYENNLFLLSFKTSVWYSSGGLFVILIIILFINVAWEWKRFKDLEEERKYDAGILRPNIFDIILFISGAVCQQGSNVELKGSLGRIVLFILFLTCIFLYTSYSANIVALLQSSSSKIHSLEDLLHSRLKFGVHDTVFNRYYFSTATEPVRQAIYKTKVAPPGVPPRFMSLEEGVKKMQKGLFAFHMETGVGYKFVGKYFQEGEKCGLKEIQYLQVIDPFLAVRKNTPYKEMFKIGMHRIKEHGLQSRENQLLYTKKPKCSGQDGNFVSVSMVDCYPALLVLAYGALVSVSIVIMEIIAHKKEKALRDMPVIKYIFPKIEIVIKELDEEITYAD